MLRDMAPFFKRLKGYKKMHFPKRTGRNPENRMPADGIAFMKISGGRRRFIARKGMRVEKE
jgi:hypothetical protein